MSERTDNILRVIDSGLEAAGEPADSDRVRVLQEEVWAQLNEAVEWGEYTMDEALGRYRLWHNSYCLGRMAAAGEVPDLASIHPTAPPPAIA